MLDTTTIIAAIEEVASDAPKEMIEALDPVARDYYIRWLRSRDGHELIRAEQLRIAARATEKLGAPVVPGIFTRAPATRSAFKAWIATEPGQAALKDHEGSWEEAQIERRAAKERRAAVPA